MTPGPWRAAEWSCHAATTVVATVSGQRVVVAECAGHGRHARDCVGDALAIAALPQMRAALEAIVRAADAPSGIVLDARDALIREARYALAAAGIEA